MEKPVKSTFNLPDFNKKIPLYDSAATLGATTNGKAPNIKGDLMQNLNDRTGQPSGCFYTADSSSRRRCAGENGGGYHMVFNANNNSTVYDDNATGIIPAGVYMNICVKY